MRALLRLGAVVAVLPYLGMVYLLVTGRASWSSFAYAGAIGVLLVGLVTLPDPRRDGDAARGRRRGLSRAAVVALAAVALVRALAAGDGRRLRVDQGQDAGSSARLVNRLVDEGDVAVAGTRVLVASGMVHDDVRELPSAMTAAYVSFRRDEGDSPSPVVATYLGLEQPAAFDLVLIEPPESSARPTSAVVFLHGYAGNFDLPCWQIARAVATSGALTACPSTRYVGDWWSPDGEATLRRTVDVLHARGIDRIVLAGLSNGGYGAARLAPRMKGTFAGLILVSGAPGDAPGAGIPTLVMHGTRDTMTSFEASRRYATRTGARMVALEAGHFAMLVRAEQADREIRDFVAARVETRARR